MNIVILYRTPYYKIRYHEVIDHYSNNVIYISVIEGSQHIPSNIPCTVLIRKNENILENEVISLLDNAKITPDRIISINEKEMYSAALLREHYGIEGVSSLDILKVRDKVLMKNIVSQQGIKIPHFCTLSNFTCEADKFHGKVVLKPKDGVSSTDVLIFDSASNLLDAVEEKSNGSFYCTLYDRIDDIDNFEVEEFISDDIMHFDAAINHGEVIALVASRYMGTCLSYAQGVPLGSYQISCTNVHREWVNRVINALDIKNGVIHLEAFYHGHNSEPTFLEIANRSGGGGSLVRILKLKTGIFFPHYELQCQMQEKFTIPQPVYNSAWFGHFYIPGHHIKSEKWKLIGHESFIEDPRLEGYNNQPADTPLINYTSYYNEEIPFDGTIKCNSPEESCFFMDKLLNSIKVISIKE